MSGVIVQESLQDNLAGSVQHANLIVREQGALRRITLNRPKALNALTLDMSVTMTALLRSRGASTNLHHCRRSVSAQMGLTRLSRSRN
jgi:hypothetical protein